MEFEPYRALYIHVPFCKKRCNYCDFATQACSDESVLDEYLEEMIISLRRASKAGLLGSIETVYLGGGTPSYLGNKRLSNLLYTLSLSMHLTPDLECTLEVNPDSLTEAMVKDAFALGVTRLSLGVQSFNDDLLKILGRVHDVAAAKEAIHIAQTRFDNISIDLMCGLPGQTPEMFLDDVRSALDMGVKHISIYPLMVEEGTPIHRSVEAGELTVDEDLGADCMALAAEIMKDYGLYRYEVASYAYPGYESKHNQAYWNGIPYLGLGHGAVSMKQNASVRIRFNDSEEIETLNAKQMLAEDLMLGMRMSKGLSLAKVEQARKVFPDIDEVFENLISQELVQKTSIAYVPTDKGWLFGNQLYGELLNLAP